MRPVSLLAAYPGRRLLRRSRPVPVRRGALAAAALAFVVLTGWAGASVWYFMSHDEVALKLLEKQAAQRRHYEEKITALRTKLEQASTQRLADQEMIEAQLKALLARQAAFESRQAQVDALAAEKTGSIEVRSAPSRPVEANTAAPSFPSLPDLFRLRLGDDEAGEQQSSLDRVKDGLEGASKALAALEEEQVRRLSQVAEEAETRGRTLRLAIRKAGLNPDAFETALGGTGGPFVAAEPGDRSFEAGWQRAQISVARLHTLRRSVTALPFGEPIRGEIDLSSGFGIRADPFTRSPAMHTGLDFRAEYGAVVRASGAGRVVVAEPSGAYGNMVEIEHQAGVTSRYAHLSSIAVAVGQEVKAGTMLGRVGSTGRSTGPHLHYETRLNGEAVDPQRFLRAGAAIAPVVTASR
ncbi:MAG TPA: M23 family metallopeptidase [Microvirga sp.]|nr:M23 family metallopeptidase [Microvirga sp.]